MKKIINILSVTTCLLLFFCSSKDKKNDSSYTLAFVKDVYVDEGNYTYNDEADSIYNKGDGERTENFIGVFSKKNDTIIIYKLHKDLSEQPEKFSFWLKKINNQSITFYCSMGDNIKITFRKKNNVLVNNDKYQVNNEYYNFLKQKILIEKSILDLAFFLKDGYGDYAHSLEPLNKNWRNQKENNKHKIIYASIKNKNNQTDDKHFNYKIDYNYNKKGMLQSISGEESFKKEFVDENNKYFIYKIEKSINERATIFQDLYLNKKTLFDSIVGSYEQYSNSKTTYFTKYQSKLKTKNVYSKPKNIQEALQLLEIN